LSFGNDPAASSNTHIIQTIHLPVNTTSDVLPLETIEPSFSVIRKDYFYSYARLAYAYAYCLQEVMPAMARKLMQKFWGIAVDFGENTLPVCSVSLTGRRVTKLVGINGCSSGSGLSLCFGVYNGELRVCATADEALGSRSELQTLLQDIVKDVGKMCNTSSRSTTK